MYLRDASLHLSTWAARLCRVRRRSPHCIGWPPEPCHIVVRVTGAIEYIRLATALLAAAGRNQGGTNRVRVPSDL